MSATKRQKGEVNLETADAYEMPKPPKYKRGPAFLSAIKDLANGGMTQVRVKLDLPYFFRKETTKSTSKKRTFKDYPQEISTQAVIGINKPNENENFIQGMMMPLGKTSYFANDRKGKAIPSSMTLNTATMESRAIKYLTMGSSTYTPKDDVIAENWKPDSEAKRNGSVLREDEHWGGLALGSFLEEVTAKRGLNISRVGSAMRGKAMASKWRMKSGGKDAEDDFGTNMLSAFPQLGKQKMGPGLGAAALYQKLKSDGAERAEVLKHHLGLGGSIYKSNLEARNGAKDRFDKKLAAIKSGQKPKTQGGWWKEAAKNVDFKNLTASEAKELRWGYMQTKLGRHDIDYVATPHRTAKAMAKKDLENRGIDKKTNAALYQQEKRNFVLDTMRAAGFATTKVEKQHTSKDKFEAKLKELQEGRTVKGSWWADKAKSFDFKALQPGERKELKQQYVAHRKPKP